MDLTTSPARQLNGLNGLNADLTVLVTNAD